MPDRAMGWMPEPIVEELSKPSDPKLAYKEDQLKQLGDAINPIGRGEAVYADRGEVEALPAVEPPIEVRTAKQEALIQAIQHGETGSLACQADPECREPFSPPVDLPFGDILAEERCDASS